MDELQRWLDIAPTLRRAGLVYTGGGWTCSVWLTEDPDGSAVAAFGNSVTFAVVAAILDFHKRRTES